MPKRKELPSRTIYIRGVDEVTCRLIHMAAAQAGLDIRSWVIEVLRREGKNQLGDLAQQVDDRVKEGPGT